MATVHRIEAKKGEFVSTAVEWLVKKINEFISSEGECILGLSGGSTPLPVYEALGKRTDVDWTKVKLFMVDERHVPEDHKDSNLAAVRRTLLAQNVVPEANLYFPKVNLPYDECIADYDKVMKKLISESGKGHVHLSILGLGDDGHFASLFPNSPTELVASAFNESNYVIATSTDVFAVHNRITTTFPVLVNAAHSVFLLRGQSKVDVFDKTVNASEDTDFRWPAKPVLANSRNTVIFEF